MTNITSFYKDGLLYSFKHHLTAGTWKVTYFFDDTNETSHFMGYDFTFGDNGSLRQQMVHSFTLG